MKKLFTICFLVFVFLVVGIVSAHASFDIRFDEFGNGFWSQNGGDMTPAEWTTAALPLVYGVSGEVLQYTLPEFVTNGFARVFDPESNNEISQLMIFEGNRMWFVTESCDNENGEGCAPAEFANWLALLDSIGGMDAKDGGGVSEANDTFHYAPVGDLAGAVFVAPGFISLNSVSTNDYDGYSESIAPIPEPATMFFLGSGLIGLAGYGRKKFFKK